MEEQNDERWRKRICKRVRSKENSEICIQTDTNCVSLVSADGLDVEVREYGAQICRPLLRYPQTGLYAADQQVGG